jgi:nucleoside-diphosphate-sugar epimerase
MRAGMRGVDGVFHLAAWFKVGVRDRSPAHGVNVVGTRHVLELMAELGIPRGVYTSTLAVNSDTRGTLVDETFRYAGPWLSEYERSKWQALDEVVSPHVQRGLPLIITLPSLAYGPGDRGPAHDFLVDMLKRRLLVLPRRTAFSWLHVEDAARGHIQAMQRGKPGEKYILAGPTQTVREVVEAVARLAGRPLPPLWLGPTGMMAVASLMRAVGRFVPLPTMLASETLRSIAGTTYIGSSAKAERELGFEARPIHVGMLETLRAEATALGMDDVVSRLSTISQ